MAKNYQRWWGTALCSVFVAWRFNYPASGDGCMINRADCYLGFGSR
jgi:hypothetical protein